MLAAEEPGRWEKGPIHGTRQRGPASKLKSAIGTPLSVDFLSRPTSRHTTVTCETDPRTEPQMMTQFAPNTPTYIFS